MCERPGEKNLLKKKAQCRLSMPTLVNCTTANPVIQFEAVAAPAPRVRQPIEFTSAA